MDGNTCSVCTMKRSYKFPKSQVNLENLEKIKAVMTETVKLSLPLTVDMVLQPRWMEEYGLDEWNFEKCCKKEGV